ncbi:MAG: NAD(P)-dependent dehydrogenase, short-chain alcohol dehydrogenase family [Devosia sp.]|uniref:glucose 1-dehydrogenase n=1 Tax=Devosia sp. TaxID=1871048 RepID=UPI00260488BD|nr:glucose 1-dehydrogenase [Devosia sp.]MDB5527362.1 NAD(P)-dependent dehydrogenase, short-chain alcohol dehydrogenase family [Devosia sp.]
MDFTGKVALITGGGGDIGRAAAINFASKGAKVIVVDIDDENGQGSADLVRANGGTALFVRADVSRSEDVRRYVQATLDAYGTIDCFFNNAGIEGEIAPTQDYDEAMFDHVIGVNLKGVFLGLRHVLPVMLRQEAGTIVNSASITSIFGGSGMPAYVASKHGVLGLTKAAAADVARLGIRINAVCPGPVETRMMRSLEAQRNPTDPQAMGAAIRAGIPTGAYSTPEEVANAVLYLCSTLSGNITGTHLMLDGGRSATGGAPSPNRR